MVLPARSDCHPFLPSGRGQMLYDIQVDRHVLLTCGVYIWRVSQLKHLLRNSNLLSIWFHYNEMLEFVFVLGQSYHP